MLEWLDQESSICTIRDHTWKLLKEEPVQR